MKILGTIAVASLAVAPVAAQHRTEVRRTVVVHHDEHRHVGPNRHRICKTRYDHRHHPIRHCTWG
jgi:hypothetical protein